MTSTMADLVATSRVDEQGRHHQWLIMDIHNELTDGRMVHSQNQGYTCISYPDDDIVVPRVVLFYAKSLPHTTVVTNAAGEIQGIVETTTTIGRSTIPVEWRTWVTRTDRMGLRGEDAVRLLREIQERGATEFRVELEDAPEMSATHDISNLIDALVAYDMACFIEAR